MENMWKPIQQGIYIFMIPIPSSLRSYGMCNRYLSKQFIKKQAKQTGLNKVTEVCYVDSLVSSQLVRI